MTQPIRTYATEPAPAPEPFPWVAFAVWTSFWAGLAVGDTWAHKRGRTTLSKLGRRLFRTDTLTGKAVFTAAYVGGAYVLHQHVTGGPQR